MALTNAQYDEIMHEYEMRRAFHRDDQGGRIKYVEEHVPGYLELEQSTGSVSAEFGRRLLSGEKLSKEKLHTMLEEITRKKRTLLKEARITQSTMGVRTMWGCEASAATTRICIIELLQVPDSLKG